MKTTSLLILLSSLFIRLEAWASGPITVEITTTDAGTKYSVDKGGLLIEGDTNTPDEFQAWLTKAMAASKAERWGDYSVIIYVDERTSLRPIGDVLCRLKIAGVEKASVAILDRHSHPIPVISVELKDVRVYDTKGVVVP